MKEFLSHETKEGENISDTINTAPERDPQTPEEIRGILDADKKGVKNTIHNCVKALFHDPDLHGGFRWNLLTEKIDIVKPLAWECKRTVINDTDMNYLYWYLEESYGLTNEKKILSALRIVADSDSYHPIRDYLNQLQWDGVKRIRHALHHFLGSDESDYNYEVLKLFMMGCISRVFNPGCKFETMMTLVGGQGAGKSTFFRFMAIRDDWFSDDLRKLDDENIYRKLQGHWIIEMSEMIATASAKSIEEIKSFLSRQKETYKVPYETHPADRLRQCVFGGTTNRQDFLPRDRTGNRRFLPVNCYPERAEVHILENESLSRQYITQMWAEAMAIYNSGDYRLSFDPKLEKDLQNRQQDFMQEDTAAGMIYAFLEDFTGDRVCSKLLYAEALDHPYNQPQSWETREICEIMNTGIANGSIRGWRAYKNPKRYAKYGSQKGWERVEEPVPSDDISTSVTDNSSIDNSTLQYGEKGRARPVDKIVTADDDLPFEVPF